jgi:hypothetical protein
MMVNNPFNINCTKKLYDIGNPGSSLDGGHKANRLVLQCVIGVSSNPVEGEQTICHLGNLILTHYRYWIHIYIYTMHIYCSNVLSYM